MTLQQWCESTSLAPETRVEGGCTLLVVSEAHPRRNLLWELSDYFVEYFTNWTVYLRPTPHYGEPK